MWLNIFFLFSIIMVSIYFFKIKQINPYKNCFINNNQMKVTPINDFFNISMFASKYDKFDYMFIIYPQKYHFFINKEYLIYHPTNQKHIDSILRKYYCPKQYDLAYKIPLNSVSFLPKVVCHQNLEYLQKHVYDMDFKIFCMKSNSLIDPLEGIMTIIKMYLEEQH